jgi:phosphonate transport system substrate-binding protein
MLLSGCLSATPTITPGPLQTATPTPLPTATATPMPPGSPENPLILGLVAASADQNLDPAAQDLAGRLALSSKLAVAARVFNSYEALMKALENGETHIAFLPPLTYLYAGQHGLAEAVLLANHFGVYEYGTQFLANAESGFTVYFDPQSGQNSAAADLALAQFSGKRPCWVDPDSASGYILPAGLLLENKIETAVPAFSQSHTAVIRTLYVKGICDFGATFSYTGDPRTASGVLGDLPDAIERIPIIWRSDAFIPNLNISTIAGLNDKTRNALTTAFLDLAGTPEGRLVLSAAAGDYDIEALKAIDDSRYDALRGAAEALDLDLRKLVGK